MRFLPSWKRRYWVPPVVLAVLVGLYAAGGFWGVPYLARSLLEQQVLKIDRRIELGELKFNPFRFELRAGPLKLTESDGAPLIAFQRLFVDAEVWASIRERGAVLRTVELAAPDVSLVVEKDGSINLAKLIPPSDTPRDPDAPPPSIRIAALSIDQGRLGIEDRSRPQPFSTALSPISFSLKDFRTQLGHQNAYAFSAAAATGESIEWTGNFTVQPLGSTGDFSVKGIQVSTVASYLQDQLPMQLVSGNAELGGHYELGLGPETQLDLKLPAIRLRDFAMADRGGHKAAALSLGELVVHETGVSLARHEVTVQRVELRSLRTDVRRERDGSINLLRLVQAGNAGGKAKASPPAAAGAKTAQGKASPAWRVAVDTVQLADSAVTVEDRGVTPAVGLSLNPLSVTVRGFSTDASPKLDVEAHAGMDRGARMQAKGEVRLDPLSVQMALELEKFGLPLVQPYLTPKTGIVLHSGQLSAQGELKYFEKPAKQPPLRFRGAAQIAGLAVKDRRAQQELVRWSGLDVAGIDFQQGPDRLDIDRVTLREPYAKVVIAQDRQINVTQALQAPSAGKTAPPPAAKTPAAAASPPMPIRVKSIRIAGGQLAFSDLSINPQFSAGIVGLGGDVSDLSNDPKSQAKLHLEGRVDNYSPVLIDGRLNVLAAQPFLDVAMSFRNMDLIRFNPYSGRFAGYNIVKGKLTTELKYKVQNRALEAEHHVVLDQLEFGDATGSKDAVPLPVKLAVALLKDRHGVIDLSLPVRGSLDDPTFKIAPLVWKTLVNLLTKAVTAPFSALASLIGGGDELAYVDFAAGTPELSAAESDKLSKLSAALVERPQVKLDIPLALVDEADLKAMTRNELERRLPPAAEGLSAEDAAASRLLAMEKLYGQLAKGMPRYPDSGNADALSRAQARMAFLQPYLEQRLAPTTGQLEQLARDRAQSVQKALLSRPDLAPERVFLTARRAAQLADNGAVRMELKLE